MRRANSIAAAKAHFLWQHNASSGWLPLGALTLVQGMTGAGKSTFGTWLAAEVSNGNLPGEHHGRPGVVLLSSREEDASAVVIPRLIGSKAERTHVFYSDARDLDELEAEIRECMPILVIIDPVTSFIPGDRNKTHVVRPILERLNNLAADVGCAVVAITHPRKGNGADTIQEASGSMEFVNIPRSVLTFAIDDDDRRFSHVKSSLGPPCPDQAYNLIEAPIMFGDGSTGTVATFVPLGEAEGSVSDLLESKSLKAVDLANLNRGDRSIAIRNLLGMNDRAMTTGEVAQAINMQDKHATVYLSRLAKGREIVKIGRGLWASLQLAKSTASIAAPHVESVDSVEFVDSAVTTHSTKRHLVNEKSTHSTLSTDSTAALERERWVQIAPGHFQKPNGSYVITMIEATADELAEYQRAIAEERATYLSTRA